MDEILNLIESVSEDFSFLLLLNVRLAGDHLYGKLLFIWLSLVMSVMVLFVLSLFPRDVFDEILSLIGSVSEGFLPTVFIAHTLLLSPAYRPDMTKIMLKRTYNRQSSIHSSGPSLVCCLVTRGPADVFFFAPVFQ